MDHREPGLPEGTAPEAPLAYGEVTSTFHTLRAVTAGSSAAALALLTATWDLTLGWVAVLLFLVGLVDALHRRRRPDASPLLRLLSDASILGTAALVLRESALVAAPFAYLLAAAFLLLPMRRAFLVLGYLTAVVVAVFFASARAGVVPYGWPLDLVAIFAFVGALGVLLVAALRALQLSRARERAALEEALEANDMKSRYVSMVSHELRTPLTSITGFAEMLQGSWRELDPDEADEFFQILLDEARHLSNLVEDVLVIPSLEVGRLRLEPEDLRLASLVDRVVEMTLGREADRQVDVSVPAEAMVRADRHRLQQVLRNLLENGRKYGGRELAVEATPAPELWILSVTDQGPGVPLDERQRIFEHFERGSREADSGASGHGLGLPIAQQLARMMGGELWLENPPDGGARFCFSLPAAGDLVPAPLPEG